MRHELPFDMPTSSAYQHVRATILGNCVHNKLWNRSSDRFFSVQGSQDNKLEENLSQDTTAYYSGMTCGHHCDFPNSDDN
jgi:predicted oxidoreductase (fatty acid repression mutant protein)